MLLERYRLKWISFNANPQPPNPESPVSMAYFLRWSTGGIVDIARRHCPLLAAEHARRRKGGGGSREAAAGCRHLHAFLQSRERIAVHSLASRDNLVSAVLSQTLP